MRQLSLFRREPSRRERCIGKDEDANDSNTNRDDSLNDEQPLPAVHAVFVVEGSEGRSKNQTCKCYSIDVASVQDRHPRSYFFARVEQQWDIENSRIEGHFDEAEEESDDNETRVVLDKRCKDSHGSPYNHAAGHVDRGPDFSRRQDHVGGDLCEDVSYVQDTDAYVVLTSMHLQVFLQAVEACIRMAF
jgi:hypothetical protein